MDLEMATTDELIAELAQRYASLVVIGEKESERHQEGYRMSILRFGSLSTAIGMVERAQTSFRLDVKAIARTCEEDPE